MQTDHDAVMVNQDELMRARPFSAISLLVVNARPQPKGILLATLAKLNLEYPAMRKVALMDAPPPLPVAKYLAACGVEMVWNGPE